MGEVTTPIRVHNWFDLEKLAAGETDRPARAVATEALADTGAVFLCLKQSLVSALGLRAVSEVTTRTMPDRREQRTVYSPVDLEILGRSAQVSVVGVPDTLPNIVGQVPLEVLDLVVSPRDRRVIPNPAHPDGELFDELAV